MQSLRNISVFLFACLLFAGSMGINVFVHFCSQEGVNYSYVVPPSEACPQETPEPTCCHAPKKMVAADKSFQSNCCSEDISSFKFSLDFLNKFSHSWIPALTPELSVFPYAVAENSPSVPALLGFEKRPPPLPGRQILILHQVFRI